MTVTRYLVGALGVFIVVAGLVAKEASQGLFGHTRGRTRPVTLLDRAWFVLGGAFFLWLALTNRV